MLRVHPEKYNALRDAFDRYRVDLSNLLNEEVGFKLTLLCCSLIRATFGVGVVGLLTIAYRTYLISIL